MTKLTSLLLLAAFLPATYVTANAGNDPTLPPVIEQHVIAPGDTLARLARKHLGPDAAWDTNLSVNPDLENTDSLTIGQVVNIITGYAAPPPPVIEVEIFQATIEQIANDVDKNIKQSDWEDASKGDQLNPLDAVRTLAKSSAVLRFDKTSEVLVTEYSQVFLRALEPLENGTSRSEIEIKRGETQLKLEKIDGPQQYIEINIAGTVTRPARGPDGMNSTKARIVGDDSSQVMVYEGSSAVESGGASVAVNTGMGTTAVAGQPPAKPERLLEAPAINAEPIDRLAEKVTLDWQSVENARAYRVEVCQDRRCTQLIASQQVETTSFHLVEPPMGIAYWRVTAISASGLDGFTSLAAQLNVTANTIPTDPYYVWKKLGLALFTFAIILIALFNGMVSKRES